LKLPPLLVRELCIARPTLALIGSYFGEITGNGKNAGVRR
jgi:hypothetical protein